MAQYVKKESYFFRRIVSAILIVVIVSGAFYLMVKYINKAEVNFEKSFYPEKYSEYVSDCCKKYGLEEEFVYAVIKTESGFDANAQSSVGAKGLMQIMPDTFKWMQELKGENLAEDDLFNPQINIEYGCYYFNYLFGLYNDESTVIAAYNAGQSVVTTWLKNDNYSSDGKVLHTIPYKETSDYVSKVLGAKEMYKKLYLGEN